MSIEHNKEIGRRMATEVFGQGRFDVIEELVVPDLKHHGEFPPGVPDGRDGLKALGMALRKGFPDLKVRVDFQLAEGDLVATYETVGGTNTGPIFGMPATGKQAEWAEVHIVKIVNGKITDHWGIVDQMSANRQLGLIPGPQGATAAH